VSRLIIQREEFEPAYQTVRKLSPIFLNARPAQKIGWSKPTLIMSYVRGPDRTEVQLLPPCLDDYVAANAPARLIDAYVEGLDFQALGFQRAQPAATGRPPYHSADLLKLYL
jgi:transposase